MVQTSRCFFGQRCFCTNEKNVIQVLSLYHVFAWISWYFGKLQAIKNGSWKLSSSRFYLVYFSELLHLFLYNRYWLSIAFRFVVQLWDKNRLFTPYFYQQYLQRTFCKSTKNIRHTPIFRCIFFWAMSGSPYSFPRWPVIPIVCGVRTFFDCDVAWLVSDLHIFETNRRLSGCRWSSTGVQRLGTVVICVKVSGG